MTTEAPTSPSAHDDESHLASLGYAADYKREMSFWGNFALGFTYLSPVVGVYSLFAFALGTGGPPMIWAVVLAALGQLLVASCSARSSRSSLSQAAYIRGPAGSGASGGPG